MKIVWLMTIALLISACSAHNDEQKSRWEKPQQVVEGCDVTNSGTRHCQENPGAERVIIRIDQKQE